MIAETRIEDRLRVQTGRKSKVVVAMSGGVDSSVAACLLHEQGHDVLGLFMRVGTPEPDPSEPQSRSRQGCCSAADASDARFVAGRLGMPFFALNFEREFDELIDYFADEYARARTPNPCVVCNHRFKFGRILDYADAVGATHVATGHYARVLPDDQGRPALFRGVDEQKDQSYFLFGLKLEVLSRVMFPLGEMTKRQVRREARRFGLSVADKPDSVEICFVPDRNYARIVAERRPDALREGDVLDRDGRVVGRHGGIGRYTIGQRRGLGVAMGEPAYVTRLSVVDNTVTLGRREDLMRRTIRVERANFLAAGSEPRFRASVKIRHLHRAAPAEIERSDRNAVVVRFDEAQSAPTPGQAAVFYDGDRVLGGGWIGEWPDNGATSADAR